MELRDRTSEFAVVPRREAVRDSFRVCGTRGRSKISRPVHVEAVSPSCESLMCPIAPARTASEARACWQRILMPLSGRSAPPRTATLSLGDRGYFAVACRSHSLTGFETQAAEEFLGIDPRHDREVAVALLNGLGHFNGDRINLARDLVCAGRVALCPLGK